MNARVFFLGGNGHCCKRLELAWDALHRVESTGNPIVLQLIDVPYPGFENRPRCNFLDEFLDNLTTFFIDQQTGGAAPMMWYATGIGGLFALCLRERGEFVDVPMVLQGPVLWGLERRWFPRLFRLSKDKPSKPPI